MLTNLRVWVQARLDLLDEKLRLVHYDQALGRGRTADNRDLEMAVVGARNEAQTVFNYLHTLTETMDWDKPNQIKDTLYNLDVEVTTSHEKRVYGRGILVGVVGAVMALTGCTFVQAVNFVKPHLPRHVVTECIPEAWQIAFSTEWSQVDG